MIDTVQIVLLIVIVLLAVVLVVLGVQVFFVLKDLRGTLNRANKVLEDTEQITRSVSEPVNSLSNLLSGPITLNSILKVLKVITRKD